MAEVVGNSVLTAIVRDLVARSSLITMLYQSSSEAKCSPDEHGELLDVAESGDVELTVARMLRHLDHVEAGLRFDGGDQPPKRDLVNALLMAADS